VSNKKERLEPLFFVIRLGFALGSRGDAFTKRSD